ncbi:MAG: hypothetical protein EXS16_10230 [Gemmataceae bacterium]|nr:hypothetical protein [Gemmataceae bacterium]
MGFILDAIKGSHAGNSEDRLTQVFCACFNTSLRFRQVFLRFIGYKTGAGHFRARTQEQYAISGTACRADILVGKPECQPAIVVENKIDCPLTARQLKNYNRVHDFRDARKIALVKHYFEMERIPGWKILHWADFHSKLAACLPTSSSIDSFVLGEFAEMLEELGMARVLVIERKRLQELAKFMKAVRDPKPNQKLGRVSPFETAVDYLRMLEDIVTQIREEPLFRKRLGKTARFAPWLTYWYDQDPKERHPCLGVEIHLQKAHKGVARICTGILFECDSGTLTVQSYTCDKSGSFLDEKVHKGDLRFESYAKSVISYWKDQLA